VELNDPVEVKNPGRFQRFEIARAAYEADAIINLPKLKTHGMTTLTGAVKNLFGCVPGKRKVQWHFNAGVNHELFATMLNELCALLKPRLTIMDAVIGMEGNGPGSGNPRRIGVVIAGRDPVAVDVVSSRVLGVAPERLPLIRAAAAAGLGETRPERISVLGESLSNVKISHFRLPPQAHFEWRLPEWARRSLKNAFTSKPVIDRRLCIQCGICRDHCPQKAIESGRSNLEIRYRDCIRCFCCQEFCPQGAITVGRGWALKMVK
jgi:ferredoxin